jgi:hypothetical protein
MATALDLITRSLRLLGVLAAGEAAHAEDAQDALAVLNDMLDAWLLEELLVYGIDRSTFPLVPNVSSYTIGTGGVLNTPRPVRIERAGLVDLQSTPTLEVPLEVLNEQEYQQITVKGTTSTWPRWLYYDRAYPLGHVILWPVPTLANQLVLYLWHQLSQIPLTSTVVDLAPGYRRCVQYNLAVELAPEYGVSPSVQVLDLASESKDRLKSVNYQPVLLGTEAIGRPGHYDVYIDGYHR